MYRSVALVSILSRIASPILATATAPKSFAITEATKPLSYRMLLRFFCIADEA